MFDVRFKPVQKFDSSSGENYSGGGQLHPGVAEQTVIAQSQHHQQFLGQLLFCLYHTEYLFSKRNIHPSYSIQTPPQMHPVGSLTS